MSRDIVFKSAGHVVNITSEGDRYRFIKLGHQKWACAIPVYHIFTSSATTPEKLLSEFNTIIADK
jgi:hypothetical protein